MCAIPEAMRSLAVCLAGLTSVYCIAQEQAQYEKVYTSLTELLQLLPADLQPHKFSENTNPFPPHAAARHSSKERQRVLTEEMIAACLKEAQRPKAGEDDDEEDDNDEYLRLLAVRAVRCGMSLSDVANSMGWQPMDLSKPFLAAYLRSCLPEGRSPEFVRDAIVSMPKPGSLCVDWNSGIHSRRFVIHIVPQ